MSRRPWIAPTIWVQHGIPIQAINGFNNTEFTHSAMAACIASGMADTGLGVRTGAERFGLDFVPLLDERYFFAVRRDALDAPLMQQFSASCASPATMRWLPARSRRLPRRFPAFKRPAFR